MSGRSHTAKLLGLSAHLDDLFLRVSDRGNRVPLSQELADEIASTAGEVMVELADHRADHIARCVIEDARKLREIVRTLHPEAAHVAEAGRTLVSDLELIIREDRRAA